MSANPDWGNWPAWLDTATEEPSCKGRDTNLFFPPRSTKGETTRRIAEAKAICGTCPLIDQCRSWALAQSPEKLDGIWGGTTHSERRKRHERSRGIQPPQFRRTKESAR